MLLLIATSSASLRPRTAPIETGDSWDLNHQRGIPCSPLCKLFLLNFVDWRRWSEELLVGRRCSGMSSSGRLLDFERRIVARIMDRPARLGVAFVNCEWSLCLSIVGRGIALRTQVKDTSWTSSYSAGLVELSLD